MRRLHPWWLLALGFVGLCAYAYPGFMSFDSFDQLHQARRGEYGDWHPPAMAALWRLVEHVWAGPFGMLVLQVGAFLAGGYLLMRRWLAPSGAALAAIALLWFPPIGTTMAVIWKDSQMLGYALLGLALMIRDDRRAKVTGLVLLGLATAMRYNAFIITGPLVVLLFQWTPAHRKRVRYALAAAAWLGITVGATLANLALTDTHQHAWNGSVAIADIMGTVRYAPPISDDDARAIFEGTELIPTQDIQATIAKAYSARSAQYAAYNHHIFPGFPSSEPQRDAIARAWKTLVTRYPLAYLRDRLDSTREILELNHRPPKQVWARISGDEPLIWNNEPAPWVDDPADWQLPLRDAAVATGKTWLFRPYVYLYILVLLAPLWLRRRDRDPIIAALAISAIGSECSLFFLAPTPDFRYSVWLVVVTIIAVIALVRRRVHSA